MENLILILVIGLILGLAVGYVYKSKKRGVKCIGCPAGGCAGCHEGSCGCGGGESSCNCGSKD